MKVSYCLHWLIVFCCLSVTQSNWILSVAQSSSIVNINNTLSVLVRTSTSIPSNSLRLVLPLSFQVSPASCTVNNLTSPCVISVNSITLENQIAFTFSFLTNTQYFLGIQVSNPFFSDNFELRANNGAAAFATTGLISIDPKQVVCQLQGQSSTVGQRTIGLLSIQNDPIPLNSQISIKTSTQTTFRNIFNSGPSCTFRNTSLPCSLSTIFSQQILQIRSLPQVQSMGLSSLHINSINNPPFNNTFGQLELQIQDSFGYPMQKCTFQQQKPTTLQQVRNVVVSGWKNETGQQSNVGVFISTSFTTIVNQSILLIVPSLWRWTPSSPAVVLSTSSSGSMTRIVLTNLTLTSSSIQFNANVVNPGFISLLNVEIYVLFNQTNFRQQYTFPSQFWSLEPYVTTINHILSSNRTYATTKGTNLSDKGNLTFSSQNFIDKAQSGGVSVKLKMQFGNFVCSDMISSLVSSLSPVVVSKCAESQLELFADVSLLIKDYWMVFPVLNHFSTQANKISCILQTKNGNFQITSGQSEIALERNEIIFEVTNTNPKLSQLSSVIIKQGQLYTELNYLNYLGSKVRRTIRLTPPQNLIFSNTTTIQSTDPSICQIITTSQLGLSSIVFVVEGYVSVSLLNIGNPNDYLIGLRNWHLEANDRFANPSGSGTAPQLPEYQGIQAAFSFALTNKTIEQNSNLTLLVDPQLVYSRTISAGQIPQVIISLSDSQLIRVLTCPTTNCSLISQKKMSFKLASSFLDPLILQVKNSLLPSPLTQQLSIQILLGNFLYESQTKTYSLEPMSLEASSTFSGLFGQIGIITVNLTTMPSRSDYTLVYSGEGSMLQGATCNNCNSSSLTIRGRVKYFQSANLTIIAKSTINGTQITYAQLTTKLKYTCFTIQGCRICVNQTSSSNVTSLICQKCFDKSFTNFYLMHERKCVDACPIQTYSDQLNCINCPQNCYNCSDSSTCLQCMPDYFVYTQTCVISCPADYTKNSTHCLPRQVVCPQNCVNCQLDNLCEECEVQYKLFDQICYSQCPSGYVTSQSDSSTCEMYIPPEEAKYFPFAFVICSILFLIVLVIIRCFERRSLVMGNFISILSILEFGSFLMTLVYTLVQVQLSLFLQALLFVIIVSKVLVNMTFLLYFIKNIRSERQFSQWLQKYSQNSIIYYFALTLSATISFNIIRIIYSRLMGLRIFFGKFSSGLIFKPINFFSIALTLIYSAPLIALCIHDIELQNGYKTNIFYSALQTIIMQAIIFISWIVDWNRGKADQFFDYQVYKIDNIHDQSILNVIGIGQQHEVGGSTQQFLKSYRKIAQNTGSLPQWQRKKSIPFSQGAISIQSEENQKQPDSLLIQKDEEPQSHLNKFTKRKSLFKIKILDEWRQLQMKISKSNSKLNALKKPHQYISKSPDGRLQKKIRKEKKLKKNSSLDKIEVRLMGTERLQKIQKLKQYFYKVYDGGENFQNNRSIISSVKEKEKSLKDVKHQGSTPLNKTNSQMPHNQNINNPVHIETNNYLEDSLETNSQQEIQPILQIQEDKSFQNQKSHIILQRKRQSSNDRPEEKPQQIQQHSHDSIQQQNLENILEDWTQDQDQLGLKQPKILEKQVKGLYLPDNPIKKTSQLDQFDLIENSASSNRHLKYSNFTKSSTARPLLFSQNSPEKFQHRYNNLIKSKDTKIQEISKYLNKSHNETNSMNISLPKVIFESHQISDDHHRTSSRPQKQVMNLTGPNLQVKHQESRLVNKKKKKKDKLVKLSKAEQQIQRRYLERMKISEGRKSSSQAKRYRDLSNF